MTARHSECHERCGIPFAEQAGDERLAAIDMKRHRALDHIVLALVARTLASTHRAIFGLALTRLLGGEDREELATRLHTAADRAYDRLAGGLRAYGQRAVQP